MNQLPIFVNLRGMPVILLGDGEMADAKRRLIKRAGGICVAEDNRDARIAIVALEDEAEAIAAVDRLKARGLLVNAVDRPALCDFTTPAIIDRDPVLIAIGTGGASAGLAKALRQRFEAMLPAGLGGLAHALDAARDAIRARWPGGPERRRAIDAALAPGGPLDPLSDQGGDAVEKWIEHGGEGVASGVYTLTIASPDADDLTLRQVRLLGSADLVLHPAGMPRSILSRARADAAMRVDDGQAEEPGVVVRLAWATTAGSS
ncbi:precorrin-2 dehydrogenase/sirohydrochlorin ferrochelatase family protein [Sphingomonas ursincola]|uniref:precorrin-2 dehydrogenase/sirohydrochlorin ferrochelatase family protein n=1 Tax=Sphingomonas ursincola TaxID=56361 RepID=UPI0023525859|nr:bifunctional precorrin-2 dehydrogenase/sirohydrochlorin ferrochelatase [Sphingomonas ursincola]MBY0621373.1 bifunctional precorrin-2 dehydrogenase/sirohydrochlorin ferrochelatase [Sphingomonas ursincola]